MQKRRLRSQGMASFAWGAGTCGQLGDGGWEDQWRPVSCKWDAQEGMDVACGGSQCLAKGRGGQVWVWGNTHGLEVEQGKEKVEIPTRIPMGIPSKVKVTSIATGWSHFALCTTEGQVYTCGTGTAGQLGHGQEVQVLQKPMPVSEPVEGMGAIQVSCGLRHTLVLSKRGSVWACGAGKRGQLGLSTAPRKLCTFLPVQQLPSNDIKVIRGGGERSACVTENGSLFVWGRAWDKADPDKLVPCAVVAPGIRWQDIHLGWSHAVALDVAGQCWTWGSNQYGQLGRQGPGCTHPKEVDSEQLSACRIVQVATGSEHTVALSENGTVFTWGWGEHGQLGLGHTLDTFKPTPVKLPSPVHRIACGAGFCLVFQALQD